MCVCRLLLIRLRFASSISPSVSLSLSLLSLLRGEVVVMVVVAVGGDPGVTGRRAIVARLHSHANGRADTRKSAHISVSASSFCEC